MPGETLRCRRRSERAPCQIAAAGGLAVAAQRQPGRAPLGGRPRGGGRPQRRAQRAGEVHPRSPLR